MLKAVTSASRALAELKGRTDYDSEDDDDDFWDGGEEIDFPREFNPFTDTK